MQQLPENKLKKQVKNCDKICGTHLEISNIMIAEILAYSGYDFIWIDTEHAPFDYPTLLHQIGVIQSAGCHAIVRLSMNDYNHTKRVLEMGPDGVIFPMINTPEEADFAMKSCLYPPKGHRGFGPNRAIKYGLYDVDEYIEKNEERLCRFIQIETEEAVKNLPEIIKNPYIDGYIFGPFDLSGSIGQLGVVYDEKNTALIKEAISILKAAGKCIGVSTGSTDEKILRHWADLGINMISTGSDHGYLFDSAIANRKNVRSILDEQK